MMLKVEKRIVWTVVGEFRIMEAFESPNGGDFHRGGSIGCVELIGVVKIRIGEGS
jgi:hypothetical protein